MPRGHLVQTANLFDALFVFNSSFLFTRAQPTAVGILREGTQSTREREKIALCGSAASDKTDACCPPTERLPGPGMGDTGWAQ